MDCIYIALFSYHLPLCALCWIFTHSHTPTVRTRFSTCFCALCFSFPHWFSFPVWLDLELGGASCWMPVIARSSVHQCDIISRLFDFTSLAFCFSSSPRAPFFPQNQLCTIRLFTLICSGLALPGPLDPHCLPPPPQLQLLNNKPFCYYHLFAVFVFCTLGPQETHHTTYSWCSVHSASQTHKLMENHWRKFEVQYLVQSHNDMQAWGVEDWTFDLPVSGRPALTPKSHQPKSKDIFAPH